MGPPRPAGETLRPGRERAARIVLTGVISILAATFFRMQVFGGSAYSLRSVENRLRTIPIPAARGSIYDRNGRLLAENVPGYSISLLPSRPDSARATLDRLQPYLHLTGERRRELIDRFRTYPNRPLLVSDNVPFETVSAIEERRPDFRLALIETHPRRRYPSGRAVAHVMGYVGEISEAELEMEGFAGYDPDRIVGKNGIEREYETRLGGVPGVRTVEVDARGSIVSEFGPRPTVPPQAGEDLTLGLDLDLQEYVDSIFPEGRRGAVVALDPNNGEVIVMYSRPTFNINHFVGGISATEWTALRDDPDQPLLNRAIAALYPPGSTWKLVLATIALRSGALSIDSHMPTACRGALQYGRRAFRCWKPGGHGDLDMSGAIKESCNVYFYQVGLRIGLDPLLGAVGGLGFRSRTGIDVPFEAAGSFPDSRAWYDRKFGRRGWTEAVTLNLAIGQGENLQTLVGMAQFYAALATGRPPVRPHVLRDPALERRRVDWSLNLPEARRRELVDALVRVVNEEHGTAYPYRLPGRLLAGKTGTAQNPHGEPHSWFVGFAPARSPKILVASIVEFGHPDDETALAVPLAASLVERFLETSEPRETRAEDGWGGR
ncbi:MAG: penicillin-binding protein 2 [Gemmatimonadota bacterium]